jgi:uncharacterized SAM-binding protein YcdF (DUF218 family)
MDQAQPPAVDPPAVTTGARTARASDRSRARRWRRRAIAVALLLGALLLLWRWQQPLAERLGRWLIASDPLGPADAVVALAGNAWLRVPEAGRLVRDGHASRLIVTVGLASARQRQFYRRYGWAASELALARRILDLDGVPDGAVELLTGSTSTWSDAQLVYQAWRRRPFRSAILVTDPYHLRRARRCFERVFAGSGVRFRGHPSFDVAAARAVFADRHDQLQFIVTEYLRTAYYYLAY